MFTRKFVDYTVMPVGKVTRHGDVSVCERCGKPGALVKVTIAEMHTEKWVHAMDYSVFTHQGPCTSCIRSSTTDNNGSKSEGWSWSDISMK